MAADQEFKRSTIGGLIPVILQLAGWLALLYVVHLMDVRGWLP